MPGCAASPGVKLLKRFGDYKKGKNESLTSSSHVIDITEKQQAMSRRGYLRTRRTTTKCAKNKTRSCKA